MDWRTVERVLAESLRRDGFKIAVAGDTFAETGAGVCQMAAIGEPRCKIAAKAINLTALAKEIAS